VIESVTTLTNSQRVSRDWIMKNVFGFSEEETKAIRTIQQVEDVLPVVKKSLAETALEKAIRDHDQGARPS